MKDIIFLLVVSLIIYIISRIILKEPILPWSEKKRTNTPSTAPVTKGRSKKNKRGQNPLDVEEAAPFKELFPNVQSIENHMIRHNDNTFTMISEVEPVNYFLLDQTEQEGIDAVFETWLAQITYPVRIYLQNRFIDLTDPIQDIRKVMEQEDDLHSLAFEFGQNMIRDLKTWQLSQPRYETKRYLLFDYKVEPKDIKADDAEELEEKIIDKAFNELFRRISTAKSQLRKADMHVHMLTTDGIGEVLYYSFNRRKAVKNRYKDIEEQEQLALYVTADQSASHIVRVKGELESVQNQEAKETQAS